MRLEDGELRLRLKDVLLGRAGNRVPGLGNPQDFLQQVLVAFHKGDAHVGVVQFVIGLFEPRCDVQPHCEILLELGRGFFRRDIAAQLAFAGKR